MVEYGDRETAVGGRDRRPVQCRCVVGGSRDAVHRPTVEFHHRVSVLGTSVLTTTLATSVYQQSHTHTHTHTRLAALFPGLPG